MSTSTPETGTASQSRHFADFPLAESDQCVKCGLCLPHCPTYKLARHEGDSPRGRIALMQGLANGLLEPSGSATAHLDGCLVCRACEPVCPAQVPYGRLIDAGRRGLWRSGHRPGLAWKLLAFLRRSPWRLRALSMLLRFSHASGISFLLARLPFGTVARAMKFVQRAGKPPAFVAAVDAPVALFLGCVARPLDAAVLNATQQLLGRLGFNVAIPMNQVCCGAMDAHAGDAATARALAARNIAAFPPGATLVTTASGCGVQLHDYDQLDINGGREFAARVQDVMHFVAQHAQRLPPLRHPSAHVVVHAPCTLRNGMRQAGALEVLRRIEGLRVEALRHQDCCGAAGTYLFEHAGTADRLGGALLDTLAADVPDIFVTSNLGCAVHVRRLAVSRGWKMRVMHPAELLLAALSH